MNQDDQHLKLLSIFHYVFGAVTAVFSLFGLIHLTIGLFMVLAPEKLDARVPPPAFIGWVFAIAGAAIIVVGWLFAAFIITTGRFLARRGHYQFCLVMGAIECLLMPLGTVLGVFTILVLSRLAVKAAFEADRAA